MKTTMLVFVGALTVSGVARAQEPPPTQPPATPPAGQPAPAPPSATAPVRAPFTDAELRSRRDAIFLMEGSLERTIELAAMSTKSAIESMQPGVRASGLFSYVKPAAYGTHLEDFGVFFQVQIPTYLPSAVTILQDLGQVARPQTDPAQPAAINAPTRGAAFDPDALYVEEVRRHLTDVMVKQGRSLDLRPDEWLAVSARAAETGMGTPAIMVLRVKGNDLIEFAAGRLTREEVDQRVKMSAFSSSR